MGFWSDTVMDDWLGVNPEPKAKSAEQIVDEQENEKIATINLDTHTAGSVTNPFGTVAGKPVKVTLPNGKEVWRLDRSYTPSETLQKGLDQSVAQRDASHSSLMEYLHGDKKDVDTAAVNDVWDMYKRVASPEWDKRERSLHNRMMQMGLAPGGETAEDMRSKFEGERGRARDRFYLDAYDKAWNRLNQNRNFFRGANTQALTNYRNQLAPLLGTQIDKTKSPVTDVAGINQQAYENKKADWEDDTTGLDVAKSVWDYVNNPSGEGEGSTSNRLMQYAMAALTGNPAATM